VDCKCPAFDDETLKGGLQGEEKEKMHTNLSLILQKELNLKIYSLSESKKCKPSNRLPLLILSYTFHVIFHLPHAPSIISATMRG